jgi:hypothetical protein
MDEKLGPEAGETRDVSASIGGEGSIGELQAQPKPLQHTVAADLTGIFKQVAVRENTPHVPRSLSPQEFQRSATPGEISQATDLFSTAEPQQGNQGQEPGFTQMFQSLQDGGSSATSQFGGVGEFTRMFQRVEQPSRAPAEIVRPPYYASPSAPEVSQMEGEFTQLLRTLSSESIAELPEEAPAPAVSQPSRQGPGEFTRIISRSAVREAVLRDQQGNSPVHEQSSRVNAVAPQGTPVASTGMAAASQGFLPSGVAMPMMAGSAMPLPPHAQPMMSTTPLSPATASLPPISPPASVRMNGRLQQFVPFLLIANLFVMLIVLIVGVAALLQRR